VSIDVPELADLEEVRGRWRNAVAGVLAKSTRKDPEELGDEPEQLLDTPTSDGFAIRPLYTALDELPEPPLPGEWPYVRGGDALRDVKSGWKVAEAFPAAQVDGVAATEVNSAVLDALGNGAGALVIRIGESGVTPDQLEGVLEGVYLSMAPIILDAGTDYEAACDALLELVAQVDPDQRATLSIDLGADPLTASLSARPAPAVEDVVAVAARVAGDHGVRAITVDGAAFPTTWAPARPGSSPAPSPPGWPTFACSPTPGWRPARPYGRSASGWPPTTISSRRWPKCGRCANSGRGSPRWSATRRPAR
jgi:methylmalonyl-CoA mutase